MRACAIVLCAALCGCASIISSVTEGLAEDMSNALLNTEDLQVAREGSAAFLIMLEGFLRSSPDSTALMQAGVTLNGAYATAFVDDDERRRLFAERAFELAQRASVRQTLLGLLGAHRRYRGAASQLENPRPGRRAASVRVGLVVGGLDLGE